MFQQVDWGFIGAWEMSPNKEYGRLAIMACESGAIKEVKRSWGMEPLGFEIDFMAYFATAKGLGWLKEYNNKKGINTIKIYGFIGRNFKKE